MFINVSSALTGACVLGQTGSDQYILNIAGYSLTTDWYGPLVIALLILAKIGVVVGVMLGLVSYSVVAERRFSAAIQDRIGPNRTGLPLGGVKVLGLFTVPKWKLFGLGQPIPDSLKLMLKEEFTPNSVNKLYFILAPALAMMPSLITICVVPFASLMPIHIEFANFVLNLPAPGVIANIDVGILFAFAISSLGVYGIVLAGWSSNSKYPFLGGIRSSAQMISYEVSMGLSVIPIFMVVGDLNLSHLVEYQSIHGWLSMPLLGMSQWSWAPFLLWPCMFLSFVIFLVASFAETNRLPFDLPESETELVGGYHTEYSSMKFALFFLGEYAALIVASCLMVTLFCGGWALPIPQSWMPWFYNGIDGGFGFFNLTVTAVQAIWFLIKMAGFIFIFIWVRWTLPRFRYDQLMQIGWKVFLPVALLNILATAVILAIVQAVSR